MKQLISDLRQDATQYTEAGHWYSCAGFWLIAIYRFGKFAKRLPPGPRELAWLLYRVLHISYFFYNLHLWAGKGGSELGPGLCLMHPNNVYVARGTRLGANCLLHHEVTLGMGAVPGAPRIGNRVVLYPGTRIQGGVTIGDDAIIGANCVITRNIGPGSVVLAGANRIMPRNLSPMARKLDASHADAHKD